ncbi:uncharacterized protein LOC104934043 isoform X2 [Larimichthys crocea]|uniref:uncharacterized protein LOC104934043 isoform X2 n=1 Tax=Larimichthys crocea TaxID=215358 RepID=UPI000F5E2AD5|nr:uncharacterized protein LOC104934043 isoform X2 [Larimichthys crocea]
MSNNNNNNNNNNSHSILHHEEAAVIENAIRAAVNSVMNVIYNSCSRRVQEYRSMVSDRDKEIRRLECKLEKSESELQILRLEVCMTQTEDEELTAHAGEVSPADSQLKDEPEDEPCGVGAETPTQIPHETTTTTTEAFPHQHAQTEKPSWECEGAAGDQRSFGCIPSLVKEEPSDLVVEWEMCEGSLLDQQEGQHGGARKGVFPAQSDTAPSAFSMEEDFPSIPQALMETPWVTTSPHISSAFQCSPGSFISYISDSECSGSTRQLGNDWHYNFQVPWNRLSSVLRRKLDHQERPTARERREMIRVIAAEILAVCKKPAKRHLSEVARKMVLAYPKSFKDIIDDEVIGSGHDSLTKQLQCRVDNCRRSVPRAKQRSARNGSMAVPKSKKHRRDSYGCVQWESGPVNVDAQMKKKKDMQKMFLKNERNANKIDKLISDTFISQRNDIVSGRETRLLKKEWPYLFSVVGMKAHFRLLTGVHINEGFEEAMATKFARVLDYFRSLPMEMSRQRAEIHAGGGPCGAVLMLLSHFKEDCGRMFHVVGRTCIADEVQTEHLPPTPCIVVCGMSPMSADTFMVAVDQAVIMENLASFTDALVSMFVCYYIFNVHYPVELGATMEFLQRIQISHHQRIYTKLCCPQGEAVNWKIAAKYQHLQEYSAHFL